MQKTFITPTDMYAPTWQFNQAIKVSGGSLLFVSGLLGYRPDGVMAEGIVEQSKVAFENLERVLAAAGGSLSDVVKVNIYVGEDFQTHKDELREARARFFTGDYPVSTLVQVAGFAGADYLFEVEAIAVLPD